MLYIYKVNNIINNKIYTGQSNINKIQKNHFAILQKIQQQKRVLYFTLSLII